MAKTIYAICLDNELAADPSHWVIAEKFNSCIQACAQTELEAAARELVLKTRYRGKKHCSKTYLIDGHMLNGGCYELVRVENPS